MANSLLESLKTSCRIVPVNLVNIKRYQIIKGDAFGSRNYFDILQCLFCLKLKIVPSYQLSFGFIPISIHNSVIWYGTSF